MVSKKVGNDILIRIDKGEKLIDSVLGVAGEYGVNAATITGLGACSQADLRVFSVKDAAYIDKCFTGAFEITNITGFIGRLEGKPHGHIHMTVADESYQCVGGHLKECVISVTCEILMHVMDTEIGRAMNPEIGIYEMQL